MWNGPRGHVPRILVRFWRTKRAEFQMSLVEVVDTGPDWLLNLLCNFDTNEHLPLLMTLWRIWHVRNEITHQKEPPPIYVSQRFISSNINFLLCLHQPPMEDVCRGKMVLTCNNAVRKKAK